MAWSFAARKQGVGANDWRNAMVFKNAVARPEVYQSGALNSRENAPINKKAIKTRSSVEVTDGG